MSGATRRFLVLCAILVAMGGLAACGGDGTSEVVAWVGSKPIQKSMLDHWTAVLAGSKADSPVPQSQVLRARALSFLISSLWTLGEANELGLKASEANVQREIELLDYEQHEGRTYEALPEQRDVRKLLARTTLRRSDRVWLVRLAILTTEVNAKHLAKAQQRIGRSQIASYYEQHRDKFVLPERRDLEWIVTYSASSLENAVREIRSGKNFVGVARRVSLDPPTISGLELASAKEKDFARNVFSAKPHVIAGPFLQVQNHYVLEVTHVLLRRRQTLAEVEAPIRRLLASEWVSSGFRRGFERKWAARTRVLSR